MSRTSFSRRDLHIFREYMHMKPTLGDIEAKLIAKAQKYMKYIAWIPGLKMVAIGNSTALGHAHEESDMDLFIVTGTQSLWFVRILVTGIFAMLGVRKTDENHAGKMCLSFFATTEGMDFSSFALENDIYLYFRCVYLRPMVNYDDTFEHFLESQTWADFGEYAEKICTHQSEYVVYDEK